MPELCRVGICGFDPMLVKGYTAQNMRAIWWHISDELFEEFDMKPGMKVSGKILKLYDGKDGLEFSAPNEAFEWETSQGDRYCCFDSGGCGTCTQAYSIYVCRSANRYDRR